MLSYVISLLVFFCGFGFTVLKTGGTVTALLDLPSFIAVCIVPFLFVSVLFGFKNMASAFSSVVKKETEKEKLLKAVDFFKSYGKITWIAAVVGVTLGIIGMLHSLEDSAMIGPLAALAVVSPLYSGIINAVIILPFSILLKKQLAGRE